MTPKETRPATMEDVNAAIVAALTKLDSLGVIDGADPAHDPLFEQLSQVLEKYFNYPDYSNYN